MEIKNNVPKVFISYSWDNEIHQQWVVELASTLTKNGIYVYFDKYDLYAGKDMLYFMETSVKKADKILIIMTPNYKIKAEKRIGGVGYETSIVTAEIFENQDSDKFIPIRMGDRELCTPNFLKSRIDIDMSDNSKFDNKVKELIKIIYHQIDITRPTLGEATYPKKNFSDNKFQKKCEKDDLSAYQNYQGGPIPQIELDKYNISCETQAAQIRHDYLKVIELKLKLAEICQSQGKGNDAYILEEGIRKTYTLLSSDDKTIAKMMISKYNEEMSNYIDEDVKNINKKT